MSKLTPCKTCKKDVDKNAKTCPHCGAGYPASTPSDIAKGCLGFVVLVIIMAFWMNSCTSEDAPPPPSLKLTNAKPYLVIGQKDNSFAGRKRLQFNITSSQSKTFSDLAETAIKAAIDKQIETSADVIYIYLEHSAKLSNKGIIYASASYAADGGGNSGDQDWTWKVTATDKVMTDQEVEIYTSWVTNKKDYLIDGLVDEKSLKNQISKEIDLPIEQITLPLLNRKKYTPLREK